MKTEFGKYLEEYMNKYKYTLEDIAKKTNSSISIVSHYRKGIRIPKDEFIEKFINSFISKESEKKKVKYLVAYDRTPDLIKNKLKDKEKDKEKENKLNKEETKKVSLNFLGKAAAGSGYINFENNREKIEIDMLPSLDIKTAFVVEVNGDSMFPTLYDGDLVIVNPNLNEILSIKGKVCILTYHDQTYVKRVKIEKEKVVLISDNMDKEKYPDIVIRDENLEYLKCHGTIIESRRKYI